jgi:plasmid stability protein
MASITIRNLDDRIKDKLRVRAAAHQRSMEEEARNILGEALTEGSGRRANLAESIRERFEAVGGVELRLPAREAVRIPPAFE